MPTLFSQATVDFLIENKVKNDRDWFRANKARYESHVIAPFAALTEALAPTLRAIDPGLIISPKVGGSISRIWRDARFSKDKSLFRDVMWCMFVREKGIALPEFFFVVAPEWYLYGCGYYSAGAASMDSMRALILAGDPAFKAALAAYEGQDIFKLDGETYKRSRFPDAPENLRAWLDRKSISVLREDTDFSLLFSENLALTVAKGFETLAPIYKFFVKAEEMK